MPGFAIDAQGLGKRFLLGEDVSSRRVQQALQALVPRWRSRELHDLWALRDVSFKIDQGEAVGIIGRNGAGKSTLLKVLSRITPPTEGKARIRGRVGTLLEVGTGFHPELNGRDNIFLSGTILGMTYAEVARKFDEIVAFSEIEKFLDTPVKRYSSGMYVRLAFAVAAFLDPEILIVDEVLAVGDTGFQRKSLGRLNDASQQQGRTVLFVSHDLQAIRTFCRRVLLLEHGKLVFDGPAAEGIERYLHSIPKELDLRHAAMKDRHNRTSGAVRFTNLTPLNANGRATWQFQSGDTVRLRFSYEVLETVPDLGFLLMLRSGVDERQITTITEPLSHGPVAAGCTASFDLVLPNLPLRPCEVSLYAALGHVDRRSYYDVIDANVDLPLLIINADVEDVHQRQGLLSLDYRLEPLTRPESGRRNETATT
jgi:lipopolysaccharide transport system ATP-binding protein